MRPIIRNTPECIATCLLLCVPGLVLVDLEVHDAQLRWRVQLVDGHLAFGHIQLLLSFLQCSFHFLSDVISVFPEFLFHLAQGVPGWWFPPSSTVSPFSSLGSPFDPCASLLSRFHSLPDVVVLELGPFTQQGTVQPQRFSCSGHGVATAGALSIALSKHRCCTNRSSRSSRTS